MKSKTRKAQDHIWDDDQLWEAIEKELDKDQRKRRILFVFLFGVVAIGFLGMHHISNLQEVQDQYMPVVEEEVNIPKRTTAIENEIDESIAKRLDHTTSRSNFPEQPSLNPIAKKSHIQVPIQIHPLQHIYSNDNRISPLVSRTINSEVVFSKKLTLLSPKLSNLSPISGLEQLQLPVSQSIIQMLPVEVSLEQRMANNRFNISISNSMGIGAMDFVPLTGSIEVAEDNEQLVFSNLSSFQFFTPIFRNISLGIGIDYELIQSRFEGTEIVITEENMALDSAIIIAGAEPIYLPGERILTTTTTTDFNVTNRAHLWSLPISLQYDFLLSQQSTIQFGITSAFRFSTKLNGYFRDPDNLISKVENSPDIISYSGLSRMDISLRYARKFNGGLEFSCGLNYSNATNPLYSVANRSGILYDKEYEAIRFLLGIRYTLR